MDSVSREICVWQIVRKCDEQNEESEDDADRIYGNLLNFRTFCKEYPCLFRGIGVISGDTGGSFNCTVFKDKRAEDSIFED